MKRKLDFIENLKTAILVVLFLITILLLYLSYNQDGSSFSLEEILPGGRSSQVSIDVDEYLAPSYTIKVGENGHYLITYKNQIKAFEVASECAQSLLSASNIEISEISEEAYNLVCRDINSVQLIFDYDFPFDDYCKKILGKTIKRPDNLNGFRSLLFSDQIKSDLYMRNMAGNCFKISVAENYYSTEALSRVLNFDGGEIRFMDIYELGFKSIGDDIVIAWDEIPERIFGDTLDFVRKITDGQGNETYMYGYGQKRLSINESSGFEYKCDITGTNTPDFYTDLEVALKFIKEKLDVSEDLIKIKTVSTIDDEGVILNHFIFDTDGYAIEAEVKAEDISYFKITNQEAL